MVHFHWNMASKKHHSLTLTVQNPNVRLHISQWDAKKTSNIRCIQTFWLLACIKIHHIICNECNKIHIITRQSNKIWVKEQFRRPKLYKAIKQTDCKEAYLSGNLLCRPTLINLVGLCWLTMWAYVDGHDAIVMSIEQSLLFIVPPARSRDLLSTREVHGGLVVSCGLGHVATLPAARDLGLHLAAAVVQHAAMTRVGVTHGARHMVFGGAAPQRHITLEAGCHMVTIVTLKRKKGKNVITAIYENIFLPYQSITVDRWMDGWMDGWIDEHVILVDITGTTILVPCL